MNDEVVRPVALRVNEPAEAFGLMPLTDRGDVLLTLGTVLELAHAARLLALVVQSCPLGHADDATAARDSRTSDYGLDLAHGNDNSAYRHGFVTEVLRVSILILCVQDALDEVLCSVVVVEG